MATTQRLLVRGGQVYDHDGDVHKPAIADILIDGGKIVSVGAEATAGGADATILDATDRLVIPGLINAHYHSHDTLCRGMFEELPLEFWLLYTLPMGANRSKEEVRARTLVGALESLRAGITTVQDMLGLVPLSEDYVDVVLSAYKEIGIRVVFSPMVSDIPPIGMIRHKDVLPPDVQEMLGTQALPAREQLDFLDAQFRRKPTSGTLHWAVAPFAPQRCTPKMLEGCAALADRHDLGVYTHVYETRAQVLIARELFAEHQGSLIKYLDSTSLLGPRLNIVHSVWIARDEMDRMAKAGAGIVLNHLSNLKLKSGIAPVCDLRNAGVRLGLGCDNCSGSDVQSIFQAMKLFCLFTAASEPEPGPGLAHEVLRHATLGNARTAGLSGQLGALKAGYKADMVLIDLKDASYLPYNSAARQLVYTEAGRGVETVIVDGRAVIKDRKVMSIDEDALRREVSDLMRHFVADYSQVVESRKRALPYMLEAHRRVWQADIGMNSRFIGRTTQSVKFPL
jgi:5-methylthioadenosine/S-adenosylhomocysteine deaminase